MVDNDEIMRAGTRSILAGTHGIDLVAVLSHDEALDWSGSWEAVDVAIVDASDQRRDADQFPGVSVVRAIRSSGAPTLVVVLTGQYLHPGLRRRMWEAGADFFFARDEGMTADELVSVVLRPHEHRRVQLTEGNLPPDLGVTSETSVNSLVDLLGAPEVRAALQPEMRKKADPHGERSRWWNRVRRLASGPAGLRPVKASGEPAPDLESPSVTQLRRFWAAMTRADHFDDR